MTSSLQKIIAAAAILFLLAACGPIYDTRYEYKRPSNPDRGCFAQCTSAKSQCESINRLAELQRQELEYLRCRDEVDDKRAKNRRWCGGQYDSCRDKAKGNKQRRQCEDDYDRCRDRADDRKRRGCDSPLHFSPLGSEESANCGRDYNECFIGCGGRVIEIRECVFNCE